MRIKAVVFLLPILLISSALAQQSRTWEVYFAYGSAALSPQTRAVLDTLPVDSAMGLSVYGHTDGHGTDAYNEDLADRRANAVANYLANKHPLAPVALRHVLGETRPVAPNEVAGTDNPAGRQQNRRVSIVATYPVVREAVPAAIPAQTVVTAKAETVVTQPDPASDPANCVCQLAPRKEVFTLRTDVEQTVTGTKGTRLIIEPGTFTLDGQPVTGEVQLTLTEAYTYDDMLRNTLSTVTTDGQLLETGGMFRVEVTQNGRSVDTVVRKPILTTIPLASSAPDLELFYEDSPDPHGGKHFGWREAVSGRKHVIETEPVGSPGGGEQRRFWGRFDGGDDVHAFWSEHVFSFNCSNADVILPGNPFQVLYDDRTPQQKRADSLKGRTDTYYHPDSGAYSAFLREKMMKYNRLFLDNKFPSMTFEEFMDKVTSEETRKEFPAVIADTTYQRRTENARKVWQEYQQRFEGAVATFCPWPKYGITLPVVAPPSVQSKPSTMIQVAQTPSTKDLKRVNRVMVEELGRLGWANIDRFLDMPLSKTTRVQATGAGLGASENVQIVFVLKRYRLVLSGYLLDGKYVTQPVPKGEEGALVMLEFVGKEVRAAMLPITTGTAESYTLTPGSHTLAEVLAYLKSY